MNGRSCGRPRHASEEKEIAERIPLEALAVDRAIGLAQAGFDSAVPQTAEKERCDTRSQLSDFAPVLGIVERGIPGEAVLQLDGRDAEQRVKPIVRDLARVDRLGCESRR